MKKKILSILLLVLVVLNVFGCNTKKTVSSQKYDLSISKEAVDLYEKKSIGFKSVENARTLGGFSTSDGRKVKNNLLVRSAHLGKLSDEEKKVLIDLYNIKYIVDFRSENEKSKDEDKEIDGATYQRIDIIESSGSSNNINSDAKEITGNHSTDKLISFYLTRGTSEDMYFGIINSKVAKEGYRKFFDILLQNDGGTIFHCSSGKDRAGFASAFLLYTLGVDRNTILNDFEASNVHYKDSVAKTCALLETKNFSKDDIVAIGHLLSANREGFVKVLDKIDATYGGMDAYIRNEIGLSDVEIDILKNKYLE